MKRLLIFALLGPPIGLLTLFASERVWPFNTPVLAVYSLLFAYVIGIIPALIVCFVDWQLREWSWRPVYCAAAGYLATYLLFIKPFDMRFFDWKGMLLVGLIGAVPAAMCSWLSSEKQNGRTA